MNIEAVLAEAPDFFNVLREILIAQIAELDGAQTLDVFRQLRAVLIVPAFNKLLVCPRLQGLLTARRAFAKRWVKAQDCPEDGLWRQRGWRRRHRPTPSGFSR